MRKLVLGFGLIILLIGLLLIACSDISLASSELETLVNVDNTGETQRTYRVSHNFTQGQIMVVDFLPPVDWYVSFNPIEPATDTTPATAFIWVNISDTVSNSNGTWFEASFAEYNGKPYLYNISMFEFGNNLAVESKLRFIGGTVLFSDTYTVEVIPIPDAGYPPSTITLYLKIPTEEKPYTYLFAAGAAVSILGIPPLILSFKKQRRKHSATRNSKTLRL